MTVDRLRRQSASYIVSDTCSDTVTAAVGAGISGCCRERLLLGRLEDLLGGELGRKAAKLGAPMATIWTRCGLSHCFMIDPLHQMPGPSI